MIAFFTRRRDAQIMGLELLSITLGLQTFKGMLQGRKVVIHSDNTGAEVRPHVVAHAFALLFCVLLLQVAFRRGSARSCDHAQIVHRQWLHAAVERLDIHVVRVATDDNLADLPSRQVRIPEFRKRFPCSVLFLRARSSARCIYAAPSKCSRCWSTETFNLRLGRYCRNDGELTDLGRPVPAACGDVLLCGLNGRIVQRLLGKEWAPRFARCPWVSEVGVSATCLASCRHPSPPLAPVSVWSGLLWRGVSVLLLLDQMTERPSVAAGYVEVRASYECLFSDVSLPRSFAGLGHVVAHVRMAGQRCSIARAVQYARVK